MNAGDTFLIDEPGTSYDSHLWMVISNPDSAHFVLLVNFTSWREDKDQACVVHPDEHKYLSKKSCVNYAKAKIVPIPRLVELANEGLIKLHEPLSESLLRKIRDGAGNSREMELGHWQFLVEQGLVAD